MKYAILFFYLIVCSTFGYAQEESGQALVEYIQNNMNKASEASANKDYKQAELLMWQAVRKYATYPEKVRSEYVDMLGNVYYNLACYLSLQNREKGALDAFAKAIANEWCQYSHANRDRDLDNIRGNKKFQELMLSIREKGDYVYLLQQSNGYINEDYSAEQYRKFKFTYMNPNDSNLVKVRQYFNLDSIAGCGDEISKIKNLMFWVHEVVRHDGGSMNPDSRNAIDMVELCRKENRGINCRMMAQILNECYLAMGFNSRYVTCMPKVMINDCHVINVVYSCTLDKWIWMDPTFNAYVTDGQGNLLGIGEVRDRLKNNKPLVLNEDANWNNKVKQTKEAYLDGYMAKNLYYVTCPLRSEFNSETHYEGKIWSEHMALIPKNFKSSRTDDTYRTSNEHYFWQSPYDR